MTVTGRGISPPKFYEILLFINTIFLLLVIRFGLHIDLHPDYGFSIVKLFVLGLFLYLCIFILFSAIVVSIKSGVQRGEKLIKSFVRISSLISYARIFLLMISTVYCYVWLKLFIPLLNHRLFDNFFYPLDESLHLGIDPNRFLIALFPYSWLLRFLDFEYGAFHLTLILGISFFLATPSTSERARFARSFSLLWLAGVWLYVIFPTVGPCYLFPGDFQGILKNMPMVGHLQHLLMQNYLTIKAFGRSNEVRKIIPVFGVAAFPSLHVASHAFLTFWARTRNRAVFLFFATLTFLTFIGSVITGWHYAIDGYAGIVLAGTVVWMFDRRPKTESLPRRLVVDLTPLTGIGELQTQQAVSPTPNFQENSKIAPAFRRS